MDEDFEIDITNKFLDDNSEFITAGLHNLGGWAKHELEVGE